MFMVVEGPQHGALELVGDPITQTVSDFTMSDVYNSRLFYVHDGSEVMTDQFLFIVSDGKNPNFVVEQDGTTFMTSQPQVGHDIIHIV